MKVVNFACPQLYMLGAWSTFAAFCGLEGMELHWSDKIVDFGQPQTGRVCDIMHALAMH
jgi:branched-subunit amino acid ABC-type transport system permease component